MTVRFLFLPASEVGPYVEGMRAIERATEYPIADGADAFTIDHGAAYTPFFSRLGRDARFILALDGDRVVGSVAGVGRDVRIRGRTVYAVYGADWKIAPDRRGTGLSRRMMFWGFGRIFTNPELLTWRYAYIAAMRGAKGDVMRATRGVHPARLSRRAARLAVYFVPPERLAALPLAGAPAPPPEGDGVDLSYFVAGTVEPPGIVSTAGRKDLRLRSTGEPWPLVHLPFGPAHWRPTWGAYLRACGEALVRGRAAPGPICCFAVDERLTSHTGWLSSCGIERGAVCTVYALDLTLRARRARWLHLATSEI